MDIAPQAVNKGASRGNWREPGRVQGGTHRGTLVAKVTKMLIAEERVHGRKLMARKEAKKRRQVARVTAGHAGHVAKHDTLQPCVQQEATRIDATGEEESEVNEKNKCKRGLSWKRVNMNSGKK